jgi:hypothetical protein
MSSEHPPIMGSAVSGMGSTVSGTRDRTPGFRALGDRGVFVTVVGPMKYVGETKLSRLKTAQVIGHVPRRIVTALD